MTIVDFLENWCKDHDLDLIVETSYGLNVERDKDVSDRETNTDRIAIFYNIIETGNMAVLSDRKIQVAHNYEIGALKRTFKEADGSFYYNDIKLLLELLTDVFKAIYKEFDLMSATYETAVDSLDSNNVVCKLNFTITETINLC